MESCGGGGGGGGGYISTRFGRASPLEGIVFCFVLVFFVMFLCFFFVVVVFFSVWVPAYITARDRCASLGLPRACAWTERRGTAVAKEGGGGREGWGRVR